VGAAKLRILWTFRCLAHARTLCPLGIFSGRTVGVHEAPSRLRFLRPNFRMADHPEEQAALPRTGLLAHVAPHISDMRVRRPSAKAAGLLGQPGAVLIHSSKQRADRLWLRAKLAAGCQKNHARQNQRYGNKDSDRRRSLEEHASHELDLPPI